LTHKPLEVHMPAVETSPELFEKLMSNPGRIMESPVGQELIGREIADDQIGVRYAGDDIGLIVWLPKELEQHIRDRRGLTSQLRVIIGVDESKGEAISDQP
jgi:hypothetical protein